MALPPTRDNVPALTGLRFVAAFSVLIAHGASTIFSFAETPWGIVYWMKQASGFGMTLFFVLSGFVIHYNYANTITKGRVKGAGNYLWARFSRLYPLFLLMMLVYVLASSKFRALWFGQTDGFNALLTALPYCLVSVQSWFYIPIKGDALVSAVGGASPLTWSISTEWFFYFSYLLIAFAISKARRPLVVAVASVIWCVLWVAVASVLFEHSSQIDSWAVSRFGPVAGAAHDVQDSYIRWLLYHSPYIRIGEFILGCLMAQLYVRLRDRPPSKHENAFAAALLAFALASVPIITYLMYSPAVDVVFFRRLNMNFGLAPSAALIILCTARYGNWASRLLCKKPVVALGDASYSIYLIHYVGLMIVVRLVGSPGLGLGADIAFAVVEFALVLALIFIVALFLYAYFEAPARRWLRGLLGDGSPQSSYRVLAITIAACPAMLAVLIVLVRPSVILALQGAVGLAEGR